MSAIRLAFTVPVRLGYSPSARLPSEAPPPPLCRFAFISLFIKFWTEYKWLTSQIYPLKQQCLLHEALLALLQPFAGAWCPRSRFWDLDSANFPGHCERCSGFPALT